MRLSGKVAVITGSGAGIGQAIALLFARESARVMIADLDPVAGAETVRTIERLGGRALFVSTNVASVSQ